MLAPIFIQLFAQALIAAGAAWVIAWALSKCGVNPIIASSFGVTLVILGVLLLWE